MNAPRISVLFAALIVLLICNALEENVQIKLIRVKRRGGGCSGGGYGTRVTMASNNDGKQMDPMQLALGAKALVLKVLLIKQLMSTTTQPPVITNVTPATGSTAAPAGRLMSNQLRSVNSKKKNGK